MDDEIELREEIVRLEAEIERLAETMESCRKLILLSKLAAAIAGALIVISLFDVINLDPALLIGAFGVVLGALVMFGSNKSTLDQAAGASKAAELRRSELIGQIDLRLVPSPTIH
jgi:dihydrodipicolinate synthase/N-acetylneuraminate lyase